MSPDLEALAEAETLTGVFFATTPDHGPFILAYLPGGGIAVPDCPEQAELARAVAETVKAHLRAHGVLPSRSGRPLALDMDADALRFHVWTARKSGLTHADLAEALGVSDNTLRSARQRLGVRWSLTP